MENPLSARTSFAQSLFSNAESQVTYLQWAIVDKEHKNEWQNIQNHNQKIIPGHRRTARTDEPAAA